MDEQSIFLRALEQPAGEMRDKWLAQACGADPALRARIDALLKRDAQTGSFLENPPPEFEATIVPSAGHEDLAASMDAGLAATFGEDAAVVIGNANHSVLRALRNTLDDVPHVSLREAEGEGPIAQPNSPEMPQKNSDSRYQLQGEIARGGMGAIIKGRDTDLGRDLAIKVLLDQHKDRPDVIQRFVEEAQIGGQLQHPGIAPIYELGQFADKRPFFAMKLVKGETLSKLLAARKNPADDRGRFVGIFEQVCQTMAYAHSRGVIHRDLKPANIMVGAFGEVQVMDWGLAKVLASGGVADEKKAQDKQKDVSLIQTLRSGVGSDAPAVGSVGSAGSHTQMGSVMGTPAYMPPEQALGEIDHLDERADVFGLGAILCEILTGKPPYVGDDGTQVYRLASRGKLDECFQRLDACQADAELIALTKHCLELEPVNRPRDAGVLAETVSAYLESVEAKLRETELAKVDAQVRAEELRRRQRLAYTTGTVIVATLMIGISVSLWQMNRAINAETLATNEATRATAAEKKTAETLVEVAAERDKTEEARKEAVSISQFLTDILQSPDPTRDGREIKVVELLDGAAKKLETDLADQPAQRANLQATLGRTYLELGLYPEAILLQEQVRDYYLTTLGPEDPATLIALEQLGISYRLVGRGDEALKLHEQVLTLRRKVLGEEHPETVAAMQSLGNSYEFTGRSHEAAGRSDEALKLSEQTLKLREQGLVLSRKVFGPEHPHTLAATQNLATSYHRSRRLDETLKLREEALLISRKVLGEEHPDTFTAMHNLAIVYHDTGRLDEAFRMAEQVLTLRRKVLGPEHVDMLLTMHMLGAWYGEAGRREEALKLLEEVVPLFRKVRGPEHPETLAAMQSLAAVNFTAGRTDKMTALVEKLVPIYRMTLGPEHPKTIGTMQVLVAIYAASGRLNEATAIQEQALAIERRVFPVDDPLLTKGIRQMSLLYEMTGRTKESLPLLVELSVGNPGDTVVAMELAALQVWYGLDDEHASTCKRMLASAEGTKDPVTAERVAKLICLRPIKDTSTQQSTLSLGRRAIEFGADRVDFLPWARLSLGMAEYRTGLFEQAAVTLATAADTASDTDNEAFGAWIGGTANLYRAMCLFHLGKTDEAGTLFNTTQEKMKAPPSDDQNPLANEANHDDLILWLAYKEAKNLLAEPNAPE